MRHWLSFIAAIVVALAAAVTGVSGLARACALDNVPSLTADGRLDRITMNPPTTSAQLQTYAPFMLPRSYAAGHVIVFTEIRREVAKSLVPAAMKRPWRWVFGDGATASGWTVKHAYGHPGTHRIMVQAYYPATRQWYTFDQVTITVTSAPHAAQS